MHGSGELVPAGLEDLELRRGMGVARGRRVFFDAKCAASDVDEVLEAAPSGLNIAPEWGACVRGSQCSI
jgi:hypothetical protein